jgi:hypothetical protein
MTTQFYIQDDSLNDSIKLRSYKSKNEPWNSVEQKKKRKKHYTTYDRDICAKHKHGSNGETKKILAEIKRNKKR